MTGPDAAYLLQSLGCPDILDLPRITLLLPGTPPVSYRKIANRRCTYDHYARTCSQAALRPPNEIARMCPHALPERFEREIGMTRPAITRPC